MKFTALITFLLPFSVQAVSFDDIRLWAGSGSNQAALVIDFNDGQTPRSYLWGYRWDGAATGEDALRAVVEADIALTATFDVFSFGASLNTVTYLGHSQSQNSNPGQYWSYWVTTNGHDDWVFSNLGMSDRLLANGDVDGWAFSNPNYNGLPPTVPVAAVPEPVSLATLSLGILVLRRRPRPR
ncbi:MAG: hypothetical protein IT205_01540 [Fimbriimonadaceae bacterium]|nr:hypothetical protein [Fimbriimonadaceae bacterium]